MTHVHPLALQQKMTKKIKKKVTSTGKVFRTLEFEHTVDENAQYCILEENTLADPYIVKCKPII